MKAVDILFSWCRMPDVADARVYLVGAAAIFDEYPAQVGQILADPRTGTRLLKPYPSLFDLRDACDKAYEPIERELARARAKDSHRLGLAAPAKADEERRAEQIIDYETRIKPVLVSGIQRIEAAPVVKPPDGRHWNRIAADVAARKARNEARVTTDPPKPESSAA